MLDTNPAAFILPPPAKDQGGGTGGPQQDSGEFGREFEHQVAKTEALGKEASRQGKAQTGATDGGNPVKAEQPAASNDETENQQAAKLVAEAGKDLPPVATLSESEEAVDEKLQAESEDVVAVADEISSSELPQQLVNTASEKSLPLPAVATASADAQNSEAEPVEEDEQAFAVLRGRDSKANLSILADPDTGDKAIAQRSKNDPANLMLTQSNSAKPSTNFSELINTVSTTGLQPGTQSSTPIQSQMTVNVPMQQNGWDQAVGERVVWMSQNRIQQAQIQLNPRELGPIEVKVVVDKDQQTHVSFVAHHVTTKDALEAALPKLRDMLSEQGLNPGNTDVSQHSFGDNQRGTHASMDSHLNASPFADGVEENSNELLPPSHISRVPTGAVDYFA